MNRYCVQLRVNGLYNFYKCSAPSYVDAIELAKRELAGDIEILGVVFFLAESVDSPPILGPAEGGVSQ